MYFDDELRGRLASEGGGGYLVRAICSMSSEAAALAALHALYKNTHVRADAFSASALLCAISRNYVEVAKLLLTHPRSRETFYPPRAAVTQTTVARQWCVFPRGRDPYELVMTAADTDATAAAMLSVLLEHPSLREQVYVGVCLGGSSYSSSYSSSYNVLQTAASRGFLAAINVLDAADPRILADHGEDALRVAVHEGHLDVVARLLAASKCVTPFMDACNIATESLVRPLNQPPRQLPRYRHVPRDTMLAIARSFVEDRGVLLRLQDKHVWDVFRCYSRCNDTAACLQHIARHPEFVRNVPLLLRCVYETLVCAVEDGLMEVVAALISLESPVESPACSVAVPVPSLLAQAVSFSRTTGWELRADLECVLYASRTCQAIFPSFKPFRHATDASLASGSDVSDFFVARALRRRQAAERVLEFSGVAESYDAFLDKNLAKAAEEVAEVEARLTTHTLLSETADAAFLVEKAEREKRQLQLLQKQSTSSRRKGAKEKQQQMLDLAKLEESEATNRYAAEYATRARDLTTILAALTTRRRLYATVEAEHLSRRGLEAHTLLKQQLQQALETKTKAEQPLLPQAPPEPASGPGSASGPASATGTASAIAKAGVKRTRSER